jgi:formylglycine-generating enzyme required for sulfatase activity
LERYRRFETRRKGCPVPRRAQFSALTGLSSFASVPTLAGFRPGVLSAVAGVLLCSSIVRADIDPSSGIDFVTVGAAGNAPYVGLDPGGLVNGRGGVGYEYRIGKYEVTSAQWAEFFSAAFDRAVGDALPHVLPPTFWGGIGAPPTHAENPSARRWTTTPDSAMRPAGNISWRMAAMYCNWLHNDKALNREAFLNGAYDVSTFTFTPAGRFRDQLTRSPGARYYIPSWDEWLKAAHYDSAKLNSDGTRGGWWTYSNGSDAPFVAGPPGAVVNGQPATANFGWDAGDFPGRSPFAVPLGAYADVRSPFGLYDVAGATGEWTEEAFYPIPGDLPNDRIWEGSHWLDGFAGTDHISSRAGGFPNYSGFDAGFRVASIVPSPGGCVALGVFVVSLFRRRRM